ncbi:MAG: FtsX-like permease family protein [Lachnospiraceae bacterium]|nr:FtsX-like permease family protein [Lachnospiraceae bacterium]
MKIYLVEKVLKKLKSNMKLYIMIGIQLIIGYIILSIFLSSNLQFNRQYRDMVESGNQESYALKPKLRDTSLYDTENFNLISWGKSKPVPKECTDYSITDADIAYLQEKYKIDIHVKVKVPIFYMKAPEGSNLVPDYTLYYDSSQKNIAVSDGFYEMLSDIESLLTINPRDFPFALDLDNNNFIYHRQPIPFERYQSDLNEAYLPLTMYYDYFHYKDIIDTSIYINFGSSDAKEMANITYGIKEYLQSIHSNYQYNFDDPIYNFISLVDDKKSEANIAIFISMLLMLTITIGLSGVFIMMVDERKKEIAISCSLGCTKFNIIMEILLELTIVIAASTLLGLSISYLILRNGLDMDGIIIYMNKMTPIILVALSILFEMIVIIPSVWMINKFTPIEILRNA